MFATHLKREFTRLEQSLKLPAVKRQPAMSEALDVLQLRINEVRQHLHDPNVYAQSEQVDNFRCRLTATAYLLVPPCIPHGEPRVFVKFHPIMQCYLSMGGHVEKGDTTIFNTAFREFVEETTLLTKLEIQPLTWKVGCVESNIFTIGKFTRPLRSAQGNIVNAPRYDIGLAYYANTTNPPIIVSRDGDAPIELLTIAEILRREGTSKHVDRQVERRWELLQALWISHQEARASNSSTATCPRVGDRFTHASTTI